MSPKPNVYPNPKRPYRPNQAPGTARRPAAPKKWVKATPPPISGSTSTNSGLCLLVCLLLPVLIPYALARAALVLWPWPKPNRPPNPKPPKPPKPPRANATGSTR